MKNFVVLLMALALIGGASAQCGVGPVWGLANSENPYTFSTDGDPFAEGMSVNCWGGWDGSDADGGAYALGGLLYFDVDDPDNAGGYDIVFVHDNDFTDIGVTAGVDKIDLVIEVVSITGSAIVKIEQFPAGQSFPNPDNGTGSVAQDIWDPDTTITAPGRYTFTTAFVAEADAVAVTAVLGVTGAGSTMVVDEIWIGREGEDPGGTRAINPSPVHNSIPASGSVTDLTWDLPVESLGTGLSVELKFEKENEPDGLGGFVYDPNWGAANNTATVLKTKTGIDKTSQLFGFAMNPYGWSGSATIPLQDGLYSWQVNIAGQPEGVVWLFYVGGDAGPIVSQPADQYMFLSQTDGDGDSNIRTFTVEWDWTDDGLSQITAVDVNNLNWGWDPEGLNGDPERGIRLVNVVKTPDPALPATLTAQNVVATFETVVSELNDGTPVVPEDPNFSTDIMGFWDIRLEVTDELSTTLGTAAHHEIWDLCGEAAAADPLDPLYQTIYDSDGDCEIGLSDFQAYAALWLEQSVLLP
jgi:hypothetical protein